MPQKLIVTNQTALATKYGNAAWTNIDLALGRLVQADAARGLTTSVVRIDDPVDMAPYPAPAVANAASESQVKAAIDAAAANAPDYLLILGAPDVVPHQRLRNPMAADGDPSVASDLPYACVHPHSQSVTDFLAPSRVAGRVPDILNGTDPAYLVARIDAAAAAVPYALTDYLDDFTLSADVWHNSTTASAHSVFAAPTVHLSPPTVAPFAQPPLGPRAHFINCHGATADPNFYGENNVDAFPVALSAADLAGNVEHGTVAAAECCYGAELYDPALAGGARGICQTYLEHGAYGFFGSTNIAYGPAIGNGAADLIAQFFLQEAVTGSSLGRAELLARQTFVSSTGVLSPPDLKTLAQFLLLGDPSIHPAAPARPTTRAAFAVKSTELSRTTAFATESDDTPPEVVVASIRTLASRAGMVAYVSTTYDVQGGDDYWALTPKVRGEQRMHVLVDATAGPDSSVRSIRAIIAIEEGGQLVASREYFAKGSWRGSVVRKRVAQGSKSDRFAVVIVTDDGSREYVLRRAGGNPFRDPELEAVVGHRLRCEGEISGQTLIVSRFQVEDRL